MKTDPTVAVAVRQFFEDHPPAEGSAEECADAFVDVMERVVEMLATANMGTMERVRSATRRRRLMVAAGVVSTAAIHVAAPLFPLLVRGGLDGLSLVGATIVGVLLAHPLTRREVFRGEPNGVG